MRKSGLFSGLDWPFSCTPKKKNPYEKCVGILRAFAMDRGGDQFRSHFFLWFVYLILFPLKVVPEQIRMCNYVYYIILGRRKKAQSHRTTKLTCGSGVVWSKLQVDDDDALRCRFFFFFGQRTSTRYELLTKIIIIEWFDLISTVWIEVHNIPRMRNRIHLTWERHHRVCLLIIHSSFRERTLHLIMHGL